MAVRYFKDRADAGRQLVPLLQQYAHAKDTIVVGLPRGGVVPAYEIARALGLPLDIVVSRKIGAPDQPELAVGALTEDGTVIFNDDIMQTLGLAPDDVHSIIEAEKQEAQRRLALYRAGKSPREFKGKTIIIVDDGIATGATMRAAIASVRAQGARKIVVAVPVALEAELATIDADEIYCPLRVDYFPGVGAFYESFPQTSDQEVIDLMLR
jgi:putative phosphoribosyl transferase